eukprot:CAMPEP_0171462818 /NCGR_PEP_ID=MMETSP0945-20130129/6705_1 /TAXON_ID=109269 /ORGANISM="Vaucheria litorea, Strain CCMP2940" /LENGTH=161 /DNA_ID=CAMNT_0011989423 /DNA_START=198 /DNA_END=680 /DNA_ORIENTATION=+
MSPIRSKSGPIGAAKKKVAENVDRPRQDSETDNETLHPSRIIVLVTSAGGSSKIDAEQRRCRDLLIAKGLLFEEFDGCDIRNRNKREFLFRLSRSKAYPQIFIEMEGNVYKYVGLFHDLQEMIDSSEIPSDVRDQYNIKTFDEVFAGVAKGGPIFPLSSIW